MTGGMTRRARGAVMMTRTKGQDVEEVEEEETGEEEVARREFFAAATGLFSPIGASIVRNSSHLHRRLTSSPGFACARGNRRSFVFRQNLSVRQPRETRTLS